MHVLLHTDHVDPIVHYVPVTGVLDRAVEDGYLPWLLMLDVQHHAKLANIDLHHLLHGDRLIHSHTPQCGVIGYHGEYDLGLPKLGVFPLLEDAPDGEATQFEYLPGKLSCSELLDLLFVDDVGASSSDVL